MMNSDVEPPKAVHHQANTPLEERLKVAD